MITYKGSPLVKGKHFLLETDKGDIKVRYEGKVYGTHHLLKSDSHDYVLSEEEVSNLKSYILKEHSLLEEQDNSEDLYQLATSYTDDQLNIIYNTPSKDLWSKLQDSFQEELNKLTELGLAYDTGYSKIEGNSQYLLEVIMDYLQETQRNISNISLPNHYAQLTNFIYNINRLRDEE